MCERERERVCEIEREIVRVETNRVACYALCVCVVRVFVIFAGSPLVARFAKARFIPVPRTHG